MAEGNSVAAQTSNTNNTCTTNLESTPWPSLLDGEVLGCKSAAFQNMPELYGRAALKVAGPEDQDAFLAFCSDKRRIVVKPDIGSGGQGVELIDISADFGMRDAFNQLMERGGACLVEERIVAHPSLRSLNASSINTVRVNTLRVDGQIEVGECFIRIGRKGSFTDSAEAGAVLVSVDPERGELEAAGTDQQGKRYKWHPDNRRVFKRYRLPEWPSALNVAKQALEAIDGIDFAGWDLTLTSAGTWIIVDGNVAL